MPEHGEEWATVAGLVAAALRLIRLRIRMPLAVSGKLSGTRGERISSPLAIGRGEKLLVTEHTRPIGRRHIGGIAGSLDPEWHQQPDTEIRKWRNLKHHALCDAVRETQRAELFARGVYPYGRRGFTVRKSWTQRQERTQRYNT
jgi:hypothetical protein